MWSFTAASPREEIGEKEEKKIYKTGSEKVECLEKERSGGAITEGFPACAIVRTVWLQTQEVQALFLDLAKFCSHGASFCMKMSKA